MKGPVDIYFAAMLTFTILIMLFAVNVLSTYLGFGEIVIVTNWFALGLLLFGILFILVTTGIFKIGIFT